MRNRHEVQREKPEARIGDGQEQSGPLSLLRSSITQAHLEPARGPIIVGFEEEAEAGVYARSHAPHVDVAIACAANVASELVAESVESPSTESTI